MTGLKISRQPENGICLLRLMGEARVEGIPQLEKAVATSLGEGAQSLLLDLTSLAFMDSASAGTLMRVAQELKKDGGHLVMFGVPRMIARMIDAAGLAACFDLADDEAAARAVVA